MLKGIIVFVCCFFAWVSFAEAEHLDVASEERIQKSASMPWRDFDLRDVPDFFFQNPTIVDKRNGRELRSWTEIRSFLYNNFSTKELRADAEREVLEKNNITAALFLGLSAKYILSVTEKDRVMRFLKEHIDRLEPHAESDASQKERFSELERLVRRYFFLKDERSDEKDIFSSFWAQINKMEPLSPEELKGMEKEILDSTDDKLKFMYLSLRIFRLTERAVLDERLSEKEYSMAVELGRSPEISREAYLSLRAGAEIKFHGFSMPAAILLNYNGEMGRMDLIADMYALTTSLIFDAAGYCSYLSYSVDKVYAESAPNTLLIVLAKLLLNEKDEEAIRLLGFLDSIPEKNPTYFNEFKQIEPLLSQRKSMMTKRAYDAAYLRGKEQYARGHLYENEDYESRFRKSMLSIFRLENLKKN